MHLQTQTFGWNLYLGDGTHNGNAAQFNRYKTLWASGKCALSGIPGGAKFTWHSISKSLPLVWSGFYTIPYFRNCSDKNCASVNCKKLHRDNFNCCTKQTACSNLKRNTTSSLQFLHKVVSCIYYTAVLEWWRLFKADNVITGTRLVDKVVPCSSRSNKYNGYTIYKTNAIS